MIFSAGCNNPSGGSVVSRNHTPLLDPPGAFAFTQIRAANGNVSLTWGPSARVSDYKVFMGTATNAVTTPVTCSATATTCSVTGLDPSTLYYFRVLASNAAGTKYTTNLGPALSVGSFDITSSSPSDGTMNIAWDPSIGATSYNITYGTRSGSYIYNVSNVTSP